MPSLIRFLAYPCILTLSDINWTEFSVCALTSLGPHSPSYPPPRPLSIFLLVALRPADSLLFLALTALQQPSFSFPLCHYLFQCVLFRLFLQSQFDLFSLLVLVTSFFVAQSVDLSHPFSLIFSMIPLLPPLFYSAFWSVSDHSSSRCHSDVQQPLHPHHAGESDRREKRGGRWKGS